ncbi:hypothetical protein FZC83_01955 [Rossellomorea marisflavi]|uniref:Uncharacterized protein n=1 Tax=Rossellomorea marisflavi TaxID=189381 RepID=A0A5D4S098_9BACI|nr:hypothetical protein [Rossellomorea marisflavi]TYS56359.1 hypothetical protein FZC83_01955 [Rossellomorea marisflavi]
MSSTPKTLEEFVEMVKDIESQPQSYNSIAESLADATFAFFNYFASKHGMTGFQASWSGLKFLMKSRGTEHPIMIVEGGKLLYPQYDLHKDLQEFIDDTIPQLKEEAAKNLNEANTYTSERVIEHWKTLAGIEV